MNFIGQLKKKTIAYGIGVLGAILSLAALIMYIVYVSRGGSNLAAMYLLIIFGIAIVAFLFFYDGIFGDLLAMLVPILFTLAAVMQLYSDYGNIVDMVNDIKMYGNANLAQMNIAMTILLLLGSILTIVACFMKKEKVQEKKAA